MSFRLIIGGISHETNTYCKEPTRYEEFRILRGQEIIEGHRGVKSYLGGMLDAAAELGAEVVPTFRADATPSGTIAADAYQRMLGELLASIGSALPADAIALNLHGAGVVEGIDDLEGHLCQAVRKLVGPDVKIVITLDLHGNLTQAMADAAHANFGVHYYPHTDMYDRGLEAVHFIGKLLRGEVRPVTHVETLPMLLVPLSTDLHPAKTVLELCREQEAQPGIIDCTFFHGFPYADLPHIGAYVVATADGDRELARAAARRVAAWVWEHREEFRAVSLTPEEAIARALATDGGPVVINDTADNPGAGTPGDATHLLRAMIAANLQDACFGFICDPETVEAAHAAGVGATVDVRLGGKYDSLHGAPLELSAYVKCLTDGKFIRQSPMERGARVDQGKTARLQAGGIDIVVASVRSQTLDPEIFLLHGIDVARYKIVALKSSNHFRAGFASVARAIVTADSPGLSTLKIERFPRERSPRSLWPLDPNCRYE